MKTLLWAGRHCVAGLLWPAGLVFDTWAVDPVIYPLGPDCKRKSITTPLSRKDWKRKKQKTNLLSKKPLCLHCCLLLFFYIIWTQQLSFTFHDEWANRNAPKSLGINPLFINIFAFSCILRRNVLAFSCKVTILEIHNCVFVPNKICSLS